MGKQNGMSVRWKIAFGLWFLVWVGSELWQPTAMPFFPNIAVWWYWLGLFALLFAFEMIAIFGSDDSLTEMLRGLMAGDPRMSRTLGAGIGVALSLRVASLPFLKEGVEHPIFFYGPWVIVGIGMAGWLADHFPKFEPDGREIHQKFKHIMAVLKLTAMFIVILLLGLWSMGL